MSKATATLDVCRRLLGITEKPGNSGFSNAQFERDMKIIGWYVGAPWCAFVVRYIMLEVYHMNDKILKVVKSCFTGGAVDTYNRIVKDGTFSVGSVPKVGAIVIWKHGYGPSGHAGIVESFDLKDNTMYCYEGNTNAAGSREGNTYARKARTIDRPFKADGLNVVGYIYLEEI